MPTMEEEDGTWRFSPNTPLGAGIEIDTNEVSWAVYVMYLDDHVEVCRLLLDRVESLIRVDREFAVEKYHEPLGFCPADAIDVEDYGCTMWCRGGVFDGAYPFPV